MTRATQITSINPLHRLLAAGCAALVLLLGVMTVNPALHAWAHQDSTAVGCAHQPSDQDHLPPAGDNSHLCAVTLFAQGLALATPVIAPEAKPAAWQQMHFPVVEEQLLTTPRFLHLPERGPPVA